MTQLPPTAKHDAAATAALETLAVGERQQAWTRLNDYVRNFVEHWSRDTTPPQIADYLPSEPPGLRHLTLNELIKIDLRQRWQRSIGKSIEAYLAEFPELAPTGELPCDVIVEEFQVRQQLGLPVDIDSFVARFPQQAESLRRVIAQTPPTITTTMIPPERPDTLAAGQKIDDFDLLVGLGQGAFASVFLARQISMQRLVALKVSADRGQEPQTLAQLDHPHIVRVFDQRQAPDRPFRLLYMQYVSGGTLLDAVNQVRLTPLARRSGQILLTAIDNVLASRGDSPPSDSSLRRFLAAATWPEAVCWLGARLADALDYAHDRGVLHRDIKPANVLLAADGSPKLADFNISYCSKLDGATAAAYMGGSLAYMSPEQLEACDPKHERTGDDLDGRSDLYSLAILLFELLVGRRPLADLTMTRSWPETLASYAEQRRAGVPDEVWRQLPSDCPPQLVETLKHCLAPHRDDRPASAGQFARQLQLCLQPQVQSLLRPSQQTWEAWFRQHPLLAICLAGIIPNAICSVLNIFYNFQEIISHLEAIDALPVFYRQVAIINPVAFALGTYLVLAYAWPVLRAFGTPQNVTLEQSYDLQRRTLRLGDRVAWVSGIEWIASGVVFPVWLILELGQASQLAWYHHTHFLTSQVICGLLAASQSFFLLTTLAVHSLFPALVRPDQENSATLDDLRGLFGRAQRVFYYLSVPVPFLAVMAIVLADVREKAPFLVMALLGAASLAISYRLLGLIQSDIETLALAVSPPQDNGLNSLSATSSSRSFRRKR